MTDTDHPVGERVAAVETDVKHILNGIDRIEARLATGENRLTAVRDELKADIKETKDELKADIARVEIRIADTKAEFQRGVDILQSAMGHNKTALYAICGTVIAGIIASLVKSGFF